MKPIKRLLGAFPIFGKDAGVGQVHNLLGEPYDQENWEQVTKEPLSYDYGFLHDKNSTCFKPSEAVTPEKLNAMFNFVTNAVGYLYQNGIPEHTLGFKYPKDAIVTHNGELLISLTDNNDKHPAILGKYWKKLSGTVEKKGDTNPIGTILSVPKNVKLEGYIDYVEGTSFSREAYPDLYVALGSNYFNVTGPSVGDLPVGAMVYSLNNALVPYGWIEFKPQAGILNQYPELYNVLKQMVSHLPLGTIRLQWEEALNQMTFPQFPGDVFLRQGSMTGYFHMDSMPSTSMNVLPVIVDTANTLNPIGIPRETTLGNAQLVQGTQVSNSTVKTNTALIAHPTANYGYTELPYLQVGQSSNEEVAPKHLEARLLIKAKANQPNVPVTHKQIIKAFEV